MVSVLSSVVGVLREALERLRTGLETRPSGLRFPRFDPEGAEAEDGVRVVVVTELIIESETGEIPEEGRPGGIISVETGTLVCW